MIRAARGCLLGLALLFGLQLALAGAASAHATVARSDPTDGARLAAAPAQVSITFDESVDITLGYLRVIDTTGKRADTGAVAHPNGRANTIAVSLRASLPPATYIESWRVVSADSHPVAGTIRFVVGNGQLDATTPAVSVVADRTVRVAVDVVRALSYVGLVFFGGAWLVLTVWPAGRSDGRARRILSGGWVLLLVAAAAEVLLQGVYGAGSGFGHLLDGRLIGSTSRSAFGRLHALRLVLLAALGIVVFAFPTPRRRRGVEQALAAAMGVGVLLTFSGTGHDAVVDPRWLTIVSDATHLAAVSTWVGGLVLLVSVLLRRSEDAEVARVVPVFSRTAAICVTVITVTGTYQAWRQLGSVSDLADTGYGRLIVVKVVLLAALVAIAAGSRRIVGRGDGLAGLRRRVGIETAIAIVVLAVTAVLVTQPPGRDRMHTGSRSAVVALGSGRSVTLRVAPATHGTVVLRLTFTPAQRPALTLTAALPSAGIGPLPVPLVRQADGAYTATAVVLPQSGTWSFDLVVRSSAFDSVTATAQVRID